MAAQRTCLVVEDQPLISMMVEDYLEMMNIITMAVCANVAAAQAVLAEQKPDFAVLDLELEYGESGWPLADVLAQAGVPFLVASGNVVRDCPQQHQHVPKLEKPYTSSQLEQAIAQLKF